MDIWQGALVTRLVPPCLVKACRHAGPARWRWSTSSRRRSHVSAVASSLKTGSDEHQPSRYYGWAPEEDDIHRKERLKMTSFGPISAMLKVRAPSSCRQRWLKIESAQTVSTSASIKGHSKPACQNEETQLLQALRESRTPLHTIAEQLPGRSTGAVKKQWYRYLESRAQGTPLTGNGKPLTRSEAAHIENAWRIFKKPSPVIAREIHKPTSTIRGYVARRRLTSGALNEQDEGSKASRLRPPPWSYVNNKRLKALYDTSGSLDELALEFPDHTIDEIKFSLQSLLATYQNLRKGTGAKPDSELRQKVVNLRAQRIPWTEICRQFPHNTYAALAK